MDKPRPHILSVFPHAQEQHGAHDFLPEHAETCMSPKGLPGYLGGERLNRKPEGLVSGGASRYVCRQPMMTVNETNCHEKGMEAYVLERNLSIECQGEWVQGGLVPQMLNWRGWIQSRRWRRCQQHLQLKLVQDGPGSN